MHSRIQGLIDDVSPLAQRWNEVVERWGTGELPEDTPYARLHGATFSEFNKRVLATLELAGALARVDEAGQLIFLPKVDATAKQLRAARTAVDSLLTELNSHPHATFKDPNGNLDGVQGFKDGAHVGNVNAGTYLDQVGAAMTVLFDLVSSGHKFGKGKGLSIYLKYGEQLRAVAEELRQIHDQMSKLHDASAKAAMAAEERADEAATHVQTTEQAASQAATHVKSAKAALDEAEAKLAAVRETAKAAASLEEQVEGYAASFDAFQESLDNRVGQHSQFESDMAAALIKNKDREGEIDRLLLKAESMIKGATTAGLGESLEKARKLYGRRMFGAGACFFLSVLLLAASAIPLVAHILPGLFTSWVPAPVSSPQAANGDAFLSLLGKVFLLFPATWLTQFFSKAYAEFFHLEREYAHKAALARSVEGFKKQAPKYEEEITTAVFFEVQTNPSKQKAPDAAEHPILGPLMKKFIDALPLGKPADSK